VRKASPADDLKIVAAVVPKEFSVEGGSLEDFSDEELMQLIADIRILSASTKRAVKNVDTYSMVGVGSALDSCRRGASQRNGEMGQ
jgi:hypothetical protein